MNKNIYFSPGKLLLTGEYVVLDGAKALAVPTFLGQKMCVEVSEMSQNFIFWRAFHQEKLWLEIKINYKKWEILETNNKSAAEFILNVFKQVFKLSPVRFLTNKSYHFQTNLQFPADFGLGSSSTLMANLARWAGVNPFLLNEKSLGGSGYDVAIAEEKSALTFQKVNEINQIETINFNPEFLDDLILIHLNKKQDSREGINLYRSKIKSDSLISNFSKLTDEVLSSKTIENFSFLMDEHEHLISKFLGIKTVKELYFRDAPVFLKSLGAWGGDFILSRKFDGYKNYFIAKKYTSIFDYRELVKVN